MLLPLPLLVPPVLLLLASPSPPPELLLPKPLLLPELLPAALLPLPELPVQASRSPGLPSGSAALPSLSPPSSRKAP